MLTEGPRHRFILSLIFDDKGILVPGHRGLSGAHWRPVGLFDKILPIMTKVLRPSNGHWHNSVPIKYAERYSLKALRGPSRQRTRRLLEGLKGMHGIRYGRRWLKELDSEA